MAGRRAGTGLVLAALALTAAGCGLGSTKTVTATTTQTVTTTKTVTTTPAAAAKPCTGASLAGTFSLVPGSAGAGQIAYSLILKNTSHKACAIHGLPQAVLLGASGAPLPTHVRSASAGAGTSVLVLLQPGASAVAQARFSPDIAGSGDSQSGPCQPTAHTLQVTPNGGGVLDAAIKPSTSVCQQGTLNFENFGYA
ncbi:MAG TPA: DUF4232 domain-containing protein [Gaiellaceae bacterium]|nr:DUF4232 domain-containing protein [Gaiellaceae bacterium]